MDPLPTGISGFDLVLGGGIPAGETLLVVGDAGMGNTTLALQTAFHLASGGRTVCFAATTSEPPSKLLAHARSYAFYDEGLIGKRLFLLGIYPLIQRGVEAVRDALEKEVREHEATFLVLDGLMTNYDLHPEAREIRRFIYELGSLLWTLGCTLLVTSSRTDPDRAHEYAEFTMAGALVKLEQSVLGAHSVRTLQVVKLRGRTLALGLHTVRVDRHGFALFPRFELLVRTGDVQVLEERSASGLPEFDEMISGGLPAGSVTALAGAVGTGKTVFSLQFLLEGAGRESVDCS